MDTEQLRVERGLMRVLKRSPRVAGSHGQKVTELIVVVFIHEYDLRLTKTSPRLPVALSPCRQHKGDS